jgi:hypothetical protein
MRADLAEKNPTDFEQGSIDETGLGARPLTHAIARSRLIEFGGSAVECSTSSATERKAMAYALLTASSLVTPYAKAPGTCEISAIHRPSVSCSVSMVNRKSWLPALRGGLCPVITPVRCPIIDYVACYIGNSNDGSIPRCSEIASESCRLLLALYIQGFLRQASIGSVSRNRIDFCGR